MDINTNAALGLYKFAVTGDNYYISDKLLEYFLHKEIIDLPIYRSLYLPTESLKVGNLVEEWNGCSHWTPDEEIAKRFLAGYEAEEYVEEYGLEHGTDGSFEEGFRLFSKVMLKIEQPKDVLPVGRILGSFSTNPEFLEAMKDDDFDSNDTLEDVIAEDEYSLFGYDFEIKNISKNDDIYYIDVAQVERDKVLSTEKSYFDIHVTYGPNDGDGYSIFVKLDGLTGEQDAVDKAAEDCLFQESEDIGKIDYVAEIDEETYFQCTCKDKKPTVDNLITKAKEKHTYASKNDVKENDKDLVL